MICFYIYTKRLNYYEFSPPKQSAKETAFKLWKGEQCISPEIPNLWPGKWILRYDNEPYHTTVPINLYLLREQLPMLEHAPFLSDSPPCNFFVLPNLRLSSS